MNTSTRLAVMEHLYLEEQKTLEEIGGYFGISRERVRQVLSCSPKYNTYRELRPRINRANKELLARLEQEFKLHEKVWEATFAKVVKDNWWALVPDGGWIPTPDEDDNHWSWTGYVHGATGVPLCASTYVQRLYPSAGRYAHRVIWAMVNGEIPEGMVLRRKDSCGFSLCVNPDCFFLSDDRWGHHDK